MIGMNHEYYVSLEIAKLLKEAGFDWKQYSFYDSKGVLINGAFAANWNDKIWYIDGSKISAPTLDVAQRWLREVKLISVEINVVRWFNRYQTNEYTIFWKYIILSIDTSSQEAFYRFEDFDNGLEFNTCEEASEAGMKKALEIILDKGE